MKHKIGICIPYRNRQEHLEKLIPILSKHLEKQGIDYGFYVGHQVDDKLFNRGGMKNIAAEYAFNDGCDYVAWHDVDMLPFNETCDYSYPEITPIHIATKLSKYNYGLGYDQYFGGVVLFNKEQVEKTNGYSNEYWDWGQEDDDLFWRCHFENYTTGKVFKKYENKPYAKFNGESSFILLPTNRTVSNCLHKNHTISILFKAEQQQEKVPIWLVGDKNKKFIEYPIFRKDGSWTYGISFNNSRSVTMTLFDKENNYWYNYAKRFEEMWTWVTISYSEEDKSAYFYINDELIRNMNGIKENLPFPIDNLKRQDNVKPFLLGFCNHTGNHYKGFISEVKIFDEFYNQKNINNIFENNNLVLHYDFIDIDNGVFDKISGVQAEGRDVDFFESDIEVIENILPYRKEGMFYCIPHSDEGFVNGKWFKGETTARNERRLVTEMQQKKIDYKNDGMNNILDVTEVISVDKTSYTTIINTKMI